MSVLVIQVIVVLSKLIMVCDPKENNKILTPWSGLKLLLNFSKLFVFPQLFPSIEKEKYVFLNI
jgi:hypothetical protein